MSRSVSQVEPLPAEYLPQGGDLQVLGLLASLREACDVVDGRWRAALDDDSSQAAMNLAEASQGLHRALIALESDS